MSLVERHETAGDSDDDDAVPHIAQGTEATGRWSNEEHDLFIRGLELYGKGWKKIANLIKTRTVVQIRTHSQKYFQKLSKAKPGEMSLLNHHFAMPACASDPMSLSQPGTGNARKSKHNAKRDSMAKMAVAPSLKPYLTLPGVGSVQAGLYKFLSPVVVDGKPVQELTSELVAHASAAAAATATAEAAVAAAAAAETALEEKPTAAVDKPTATASTPVEPDTGDSGAVSVPEWYAHGDGVKALLVQSESLDWAADSGGDALPIYNKVPKPKVTKAKTAAKAAKEAAAAEQAATLAAAAEAPVENVPPKQQRGGKRGGGGERTAKSRKTKGSSPPSVAVNFAPFDSDSGVGSDMMSGSVDFVPQGGMSLSCSSLDMLGSLGESKRGGESGEDEEDLMALDASGLDLIDHTDFDAAAEDFL